MWPGGEKIKRQIKLINAVPQTCFDCVGEEEKKNKKQMDKKNAGVILLESFPLVARGLPAFSAERRGSGRKSEKWIGKMSEGGAAPQPVAASCPEKLHSSFSRLGVTAYFANSQKCGNVDTDD